MSKSYRIDTELLSDFEKSNFESILNELDTMGCMVTELTADNDDLS